MKSLRTYQTLFRYYLYLSIRSKYAKKKTKNEQNASEIVYFQ